MNFDEYQNWAHRTSNEMLTQREGKIAAALGLTGEAGEVAELVKKWFAHGHPEDKDKLVKELGDVLWYVAEMASRCDIRLDSIAEQNIAKLKARYPDGFKHTDSINRRV
jgi:NTP pyrophosphatase (non-canonical NTP hydrolase)